MPGQYSSGYTVGNGAALNISLGWYPDKVTLWNLTDGDLITNAFLKGFSIPFSSGGATEVVAGNTIIGNTSGARAVVDQVLLYSGTWAGGDAAGFFIVRDKEGTFGSETVKTSGTDEATVTAAVQINVAVAAAAAAATGTSAISRYAGSSSAAIGFTIGSALAEEAKLLYWEAHRASNF